jgi:hypothetical protein
MLLKYFICERKIKDFFIYLFIYRAGERAQRTALFLKMSSVLKCNSCNIVIDELLSYIQNKISIVDEETLVRICTTSFSSDEIKKLEVFIV